VYGDTADIKTEDLGDLIACAKKFQLEGLRLLCVTFMEETVTVDTACDLFERAEKLLNEKQFALSFIEDNAAEVIASANFDSLNKERVMTIIKSSKLAIDEIDLFKGVLRWSIAECKRKGLKDDAGSRKTVLKDIIPLIRFPIMQMEDVATFVSPSGMLDSSQLLEIFTYLGQPDNKKPKSIFPTGPRAGAVDKWGMASDFKSQSIVLTNKYQSAKNTNTNYGYVLGATAWTRGVHCWRIVRDNGGTQWFFAGVSKKEQHPDASTTTADVYGFSSAAQKLVGGQASNYQCNLTSGPLDVTLDCDKGTLSILNLTGGVRHDLQGLPKGTAWVPHFDLFQNQSITVTPIKLKEVGKNKK